MILDIPKDIQDRFDELEVELLAMPYGYQFINHMYAIVLEKEVQYASLMKWKGIMESEGFPKEEVQDEDNG